MIWGFDSIMLNTSPVGYERCNHHAVVQKKCVDFASGQVGLWIHFQQVALKHTLQVCKIQDTLPTNKTML